MLWKEAESDVCFQSVDQLSTKLGWVDLLMVLENSKDGPIVFLSNSIWENVTEELSKSKKELGGLLVGKVYSHRGPGDTAPRIQAVEITKVLPSAEFQNSCVSLAMGPEVWNRARPHIGNGTLVVGWYHSHPNLGAFFSGTDRYTQRNFFSQAYNVGLVVDWIRNERAWFIGENSDKFPERKVWQF